MSSFPVIVSVYIIYVLYNFASVFLFHRKLAEEEMDDMISQQNIFSFPTEEELANITDLKAIQQRIRDVTMILSDFKRLRDNNR